MVKRVHVIAAEDREPTARELRAIDREWPSIAAELAVVDAEIVAARLDADGDELRRRRDRRSRAALTRRVAESARFGAGDLGGAA